MEQRNFMQTQNGGAPTSTGHASQPQLAGPSSPNTTRDGRILPPAVVNLIEMAMMDNAERWSFLFSDSDPTTLPITRKLYRQAVDSGILKAIRDVAGRVVGVERTQPRTWGRTWEEEIRMVIDSLPYEEWMKILNYDGLNLAERGESLAIPQPMPFERGPVHFDLDSTG